MARASRSGTASATSPTKRPRWPGRCPTAWPTWCSDVSEAAFTHTTVLLHETVDAVLTDPDGCYVDGTFGRGGHPRLRLSRLGPLAIHDPRFEIRHASFTDMSALLAERGAASLAGVMMDLGVSSPQIDNPERGFSFRFDGPLDMRMDPTRGESAADFLARADERHIAQVIRDYGEERFAVPISKAVVARRTGGSPLRTTAELAELVARTVKTREQGQDPATRTFQALRILVNAELEELEQGLSHALELLAPGGQLAVISFHSLEDRIAKTYIGRESKAEVDRRAPFAPPTRPLRLKALGRIKAGEAEVRANPRSRSAVLRVAERTDEGLPA